MPVACMFVFAATVFAQTNREIVVTATREQQEAIRTPAHVTVLTADDLSAPGIVTIMDALQHLSGVQLKESPIGPSGAEISMRGFGENSHGRVLVLLDGQRMNYPDMAGINWLQIPKSSVERVEVVRGGSSSLYGDYAVAGVVNIITRKGTGKPAANISQDAGDDGLP
jgi:iron complex outermembrane recepter protein